MTAMIDKDYQLTSWRGKPVEELSREELLEIIAKLSWQLQENGKEFIRLLEKVR